MIFIEMSKCRFDGAGLFGELDLSLQKIFA